MPNANFKPIVIGVYLTSYGPEMGKAFLNKNNWGGRSIIKKKLEAYVKIEMDERDGNLKAVSAGSRDIFLYTGDIDLEEYDYEIQPFS